VGAYLEIHREFDLIVRVILEIVPIVATIYRIVYRTVLPFYKNNFSQKNGWNMARLFIYPGMT
jgi:hypothetical protein